MLYYSDQSVVELFDNQTLTSDFADSQIEFGTEGMSKLSLDIAYTQGASESGNTLDLKLEASSDGSTWHSLVIDDTAAVSEITERVWRLAPAGTGTGINLNILVDIAYKYMRASILENGVASNAGTATVVATVSGQ